MKVQERRDPAIYGLTVFIFALSVFALFMTLFAIDMSDGIQALQTQNVELKAELQNVVGNSSTALHKCYIADPSTLDKLNLDENWVILGWLPGPGTVPLICPKG